jgi:hypothetical protein
MKPHRDGEIEDGTTKFREAEAGEKENGEHSSRKHRRTSDEERI